MGIVVKAFLLTLNYTVFNIWAILVFLGAVFCKVYAKKTVGKLKVNGRLDGKTVVVTGSNAGIGFATAKELAHKGARVILACRNVGAAHIAKARIIQETKNDDVEVYRLDLSSIFSVRQFVKEFTENEGRLDVLILNAAIGFITNKKTNDGLNLSWQINQLSSVLLISLLMEFMKKTGPGKIIFVTSTLHHFGKLALDHPDLEKSHCPWRIHCNTKLANVITSNFLAHKLKDANIKVNAVNTGLVKLDLARRVRYAIFQNILDFFLIQYGKEVEDGAATTLTVALDPKLANETGKFFSDCKEVEDGAATTLTVALDPKLANETGKFFSDCKVSNCLASKAKDLQLGEKLWKKCEDLLELPEDERLFH